MGPTVLRSMHTLPIVSLLDKAIIDSSVSFADKSTFESSVSLADTSTIDSSVSFADTSVVVSSSVSLLSKVRLCESETPIQC